MILFNLFQIKIANIATITKITTKINLSVREDNPRAIALYKKCGFEVEGISKNETYLDGKFFDIVNMGLIL